MIREKPLLRIERFKTIMDDWTYSVVLRPYCVLAYFKSNQAAKEFISDYLKKRRELTKLENPA